MKTKISISSDDHIKMEALSLVANDIDEVDIVEIHEVGGRMFITLEYEFPWLLFDFAVLVGIQSSIIVSNGAK